MSFFRTAMIGTEAESIESIKETVKFWVCKVKFLYQTITFFLCVRQNPTLTTCSSYRRGKLLYGTIGQQELITFF